MLILALCLLQGVPAPQRTVPDPGVIVTGQKITPAGMQSVFQGQVTGLRFGRDPGEISVATAGTVYRMSWAENRVLGQVAISGRAGIYGLAFDDIAGRMLLSSVGRVAAGFPRPAGVAANAGGGAARRDKRRLRLIVRRLRP